MYTICRDLRVFGIFPPIINEPNVLFYFRQCVFCEVDTELFMCELGKIQIRIYFVEIRLYLLMQHLIPGFAIVYIICNANDSGFSCVVTRFRHVLTLSKFIYIPTHIHNSSSLISYRPCNVFVTLFLHLPFNLYKNLPNFLIVWFYYSLLSSRILFLHLCVAIYHLVIVVASFITFYWYMNLILIFVT
jgi:hypothetical protein